MTCYFSYKHFREPFFLLAADRQICKSLRHLELTHSTDKKWNYYIESLVKSVSKKGSSLCWARQLFSPESILQIYRFTIRLCIEFC